MGKHKNNLQEDALIQFMENHPDMARGFTKGDRVDVENLWKNLAGELNSVGPPIHDASAWKKVWRDWKACIKKKIATNKREASSTGGGPFNQIYISKKEEAIGQICGLYTLVDGINNSVSMIGTEFSSSDDDAVLCEASAAVTPKCRPEKRKKTDDVFDGIPSTSKKASKELKNRDEDIKKSLKEYMESSSKTGKEISASFKVLVEISNRNAENLNLITSNIRRVYKSVEDLTTSITSELKRHNKEIEKAAFEKNNLKKKDLEIKEKQLEIDILKYQ